MTGRVEGYLELRIAEIERRLSSAIRIGVVSEVDGDKALARVSVGDLELDWIPWTQRRMGEAGREWWAPSVGEQVVVLSPGGDSRVAVITTSLASDSFAELSSDPNLHIVEHADGTRFEYNVSSGEISIEAVADSQVSVRGNVKLTATGDVEVQATGNIAATAGGDVEVTATGNLKGIAGGNADLTAASSASFTAPSVSINSPTIALGGAVSISGALTVPTVSVSGALTVTGATALSPLTTIGPSTYAAHTHVAAAPGAPTSPPVT